MARKEMYTLKVDGRVVWTSNRLPYMKKIANETLVFNALSDEQKVELHCTGFSELDSMMAQWLV